MSFSRPVTMAVCPLNMKAHAIPWIFLLLVSMVRGMTVDVPVCHPEVMQVKATFEHNTIVSPGFPMILETQSTCRWLITSPKGEIVELKIIQMDLGSTLNCHLNWVRIYDGKNAKAPILAELCSPWNIDPSFRYTSSSRNIYIEYQAQNLTKGTGFQLTYRKGSPDVKDNDNIHQKAAIISPIVIIVIIFVAIIFIICGYRRFRESAPQFSSVLAPYSAPKPMLQRSNQSVRSNHTTTSRTSSRYYDTDIYLVCQQKDNSLSSKSDAHHTTTTLDSNDKGGFSRLSLVPYMAMDSKLEAKQSSLAEV